MGLMPLEYKDCITDSPYFRQKLQAHEKELDRTSQAIKTLTKEVKEIVTAAKGKVTNECYGFLGIHSRCKHLQSYKHSLFAIPITVIQYICFLVGSCTYRIC